MENHRTRVTAEKRTHRNKLLIEIATSLFAQKNFEAVTMDEIASIAKISKGRIYWYFPTKEDLLRTVCSEEFNEYSILSDNIFASNSPPKEKLLQIFKMILNFVTQKPNLHRIYLQTILSSEKAQILGPYIQEMQQKIYSKSAAIFQELGCGPAPQGYATLFSAMEPGLLLQYLVLGSLDEEAVLHAFEPLIDLAQATDKDPLKS